MTDKALSEQGDTGLAAVLVKVSLTKPFDQVLRPVLCVFAIDNGEHVERGLWLRLARRPVCELLLFRRSSARRPPHRLTRWRHRGLPKQAGGVRAQAEAS